MGFVRAVKTCLKKSFVFKGRARRSEYWWWILFTNILYLLISVITEAIPKDYLLLMGIYSLVILLGTIYFAIVSSAVSIRRLHDIGRSGWWYGFSVILIFGMSIWISIDIINTAMSMDAGRYANPEAMGNELLMQMMGKIIIAYIPYLIYSIILLVWYCMDSRPGANKYGENPKGITE